MLTGKDWTKKSRLVFLGNNAGGSNTTKLEKYQREKVEEMTETACIKTNTRIDLRNKILVIKTNPNKEDNGFEYTEDFDGYQNIKGKDIYINFKNIVGKGGHQTSRLREVYHFIIGQIEVLKKNNDQTYFANILDGDEADFHMSKYKWLLDKDYKNKNNIYVGDLKGYFNWLKSQ